MATLWGSPVTSPFTGRETDAEGEEMAPRGVGVQGGV